MVNEDDDDVHPDRPRDLGDLKTKSFSGEVLMKIFFYQTQVSVKTDTRYGR